MPQPKCKICAENFNVDTNFPMIMPCGRSLCQACVLRYLQNTGQRCFVCVGNHPGVTMDRLQRNYDLMEASIAPESETSPSAGASQSSGTLQLVLQELNGDKYRLCAHATDTILTVKNLIKEKHGFFPNETRLLFGGKVLENGRTLANYGVKTGNTVQMITRFQGGRDAGGPAGGEGVSLGQGCHHRTRGARQL